MKQSKQKISVLSDHACKLGEGPLWDVEEQALYWIDSLAPALYRFDQAAGRVDHWALPGATIGSLALRAGGGLLLAMDQGLYGFDTASGKIESIAQPLASSEGFRLNDGKVDPFGHFVTGAMNIDYRETRDCAMYRLSPELEVTRILDGFHCFNGPCFSADGSRLYLTGREEGLIEVFDYGEGQLPGNASELLRDCNPDGATIDADGYLWSAQWDDACIIRVAMDGRIDQRIDFPGHIVSSVMFGGPDLDVIYVTTTSAEVCGVVPQAKQAGRVLVVSDSGYRGRAEPRFAG